MGELVAVDFVERGLDLVAVRGRIVAEAVGDRGALRLEFLCKSGGFSGPSALKAELGSGPRHEKRGALADLREHFAQAKREDEGEDQGLGFRGCGGERWDVVHDGNG